MTERWRKRLGDLDKQSPNEDVFERAKEGPTHAEEPLPRAKTSTRIMTAVAAFAVFALAISVFAIPALRMSTQAGAGGALGMFPLWPAQTTEALRELQARADAGEHWLLDPAEVALRFGTDVMGWDRAEAFPATSKYCGTTVQWSDWGPSPSSSVSVLVCPSPTLTPPNTLGGAAPTPIIGAFPVIDLFRCESDVCGGPTEVLQLYQPLEQGEGEIWAVMSASAPNISLSVVAGQTVHDGATIAAGSYGADGSTPTLAYASCGQNAASSTSSVVASPTGGFATSGISMDVDLYASADCSGAQIGYAWAALADSSLASGGSIAIDPIQGSNVPISGLTAAPIVMTFPTVEPSTTAGTSPSPDETSPATSPSWQTISDVMGWTMSFPSDWTSAVFGEKDKVGHAVYSGTDGPLTGVVVAVWTDPTADVGPADDSTFPLDADVVIEDGMFRADGVLFHLAISSDGALSPEDDQIVHEIVDSIAFEPWKIGDTRHGWTASWDGTSDLPRSSPAWIAGQDSFWITVEGGGERWALGPVEMCNGADRSVDASAQTASITCANGAHGMWDVDGRPASTNTQGFDQPLQRVPAIVSWDGHLLVAFPGTTP